jgi:hypothetical protein
VSVETFHVVPLFQPIVYFSTDYVSDPLLTYYSCLDLVSFGTLARNSITQIAAPIPNDLQGWTGGFGAAQLLTELSPRDSLASLNLHPSRNIWLSPRRSTHHLRWSRARCPFAPSRNGKCREASNDLQR